MAFQPIVYAPAISNLRAQPYHQRWFICDTQGRALSPEQAAPLQNVSLSLYLGHLRLRAPGMLMLELMLDVIEDDDSVRRQAQVGGQQIAAIDEGLLAHTWFSQLMGQECLCFKVDPHHTEPIEWPR